MNSVNRDMWLDKIKDKCLSPQQIEDIHTLLQEAKAEERKRCLEALPKKSEINYHLENSGVSLIWEKGFNHAIDQAISAITKQTPP